MKDRNIDGGSQMADNGKGKYKIAVLTFVAALLFTSAVIEKPVEKITGFSHPSNLCMSMGSFYVTDIGKKMEPEAKDGDGRVALLNEKMAIESKNILAAGNAKINAPKGICAFNYRSKSGGFSMLRKAIAITDIDKVYAYELIYNSRFFYLDLSKESKNLGDVVSLNDSILFVAATDKNCIFKININTKAYQKVVSPKIKGAKGLCLDREKKYLYCVGWGEANVPNGEIWKINTQSTTVEKLGDDLGYLDGCAVYNNKLYFTDWVDTIGKIGVIRYMNLSNNAITNVPVAGIGGPGGFCIDETTKTLIVPAMQEGIIYRIPIE